MKPLAEIADEHLAACDLFVCDVDGTITERGQISSSSLATLTALAAGGVPCLLCTGRPAGWMESIVHYLPVYGAIAENGGVLIRRGHSLEFFSSTPESFSGRSAIRDAFVALKEKLPYLRESADNRWRLTDWTFDLPDDALDLTKISEILSTLGWDFTYSTVQCHILPRGQSKASAIATVKKRFAFHEAIFVGDSPNDETVFAAPEVALSVGVHNLVEYTGALSALPAYLTQSPEGAGFAEIAARLLTARKHRNG